MAIQEHPLPYQWHGQGDPLVLIAGLGGKGTSWNPFLQAAQKHYRVLTFDTPGAGCAPALAPGTSIRDMALALRELFHELKLERAHVMGRSMGGMIAQELALLAPELVQTLVLVSTSGRTDPHLRQVFELWATMAEQGVPLEVRHRSSMLWCLGAQSLESGSHVQAYLETKGHADRPVDYALLARASAEHDAIERLGRLDHKTLVVAGTNDRLMPAAHAEALAKRIPGAELAYVSGAGHLPYLECPDAFAETVLGFLSGRGGS